MNNRTVWKTRAVVLALLMVASFAVSGREFDFSKPDDNPRVVKNVDPAAYRNLDGVWQCYFLQAKSETERNYYGVWTFEEVKKWVHVFWSPVHKGFVNGYRWNGKLLVLGDPSDPMSLTFGTYKTQMEVGGALIIEAPRYRWKGWRCRHQSVERWPEDGLQFLDYARYPWLSGLVEDGREIEKYRRMKQ